MKDKVEKIKYLYGEDKAEKLISYLDMVLDRNRFINLTAVKDRDEAIEKHIIDSLSICELPEYKEAETIIDVGTGAGFPGALLAIVSPEKKFILLDSTLKRLKVIDEFAESLGIDNVTTVHARAEEIARKPEFDAAFDMCVSRAVANLSTLSEWCLPFVKKGGWFISYKGENYLEEIEAAKKVFTKRGGKLVEIYTPSEQEEDISGHVLLKIKKI
ncbi:MAG: 16S rRNA (guanine(527)-N(7))-methyltransferase RsmG [Clostridiales bacterium]|nr:16S rRNA (guanine(527)-N(7))-methyltransferase RsmG [Candidatus Crickella caballi]